MLSVCCLRSRRHTIPHDPPESTDWRKKARTWRAVGCGWPRQQAAASASPRAEYPACIPASAAIDSLACTAAPTARPMPAPPMRPSGAPLCVTSHASDLGLRRPVATGTAATNTSARPGLLTVIVYHGAPGRQQSRTGSGPAAIAARRASTRRLIAPGELMRCFLWRLCCNIHV